MLNTSAKILEALDVQERIEGPTADTIIIRHLISTGVDIRSSLSHRHIRYGKFSYQTHHRVTLANAVLTSKGKDVLLTEANEFFAREKNQFTLGDLHKGSCSHCNDGYGNCVYPFEGLVSDSGYKYNDVCDPKRTNEIVNSKLPLGFNLQQFVAPTGIHDRDLKGVYMFCRFCGRKSLPEKQASLNYHALWKSSRPAVMPRKRYEVRDSMNEATLAVVKTDDGDMIIEVIKPGKTSRTSHIDVSNSAQFCTLRGGGKSLRVRRALEDLARAIIEDSLGTEE